nr:unnamed protein product [Callosobruchus analis]
MKYLRKVKGMTRMDRIRNEAIREEFQVVPVLKLIEQSQLRWFGHVNRLHEERQVKKVWQAHTVPKRGKGRSRLTWNDGIGRLLEARRITTQEARGLIQDRKQWLEFVKK